MAKKKSDWARMVELGKWLEQVFSSKQIEGWKFSSLITEATKLLDLEYSLPPDHPCLANTMKIVISPSEMGTNASSSNNQDQKKEGPVSKVVKDTSHKIIESRNMVIESFLHINRNNSPWSVTLNSLSEHRKSDSFPTYKSISNKLKSIGYADHKKPNENIVDKKQKMTSNSKLTWRKLVDKYIEKNFKDFEKFISNTVDAKTWEQMCSDGVSKLEKSKNEALFLKETKKDMQEDLRELTETLEVLNFATDMFSSKDSSDSRVLFQNTYSPKYGEKIITSILADTYAFSFFPDVPYLLNQYNRVVEQLQIVNGTASKKKVILQPDNTPLLYTAHDETIPFPAILANVFFEFLLCGGQDYFGFCNYCDKFYIAERKGRKKFCSDICRTMNQRK